jgi:hypothetical protein
MTNETGFGRFVNSISDKLQDQAWFQQLKVKWDELDARAKTTLKYAGLIGSTVLIVGLVGSNLYSVAAQKREIEDKLSLIQKIQSAQDELRRLRDVTARFSGSGDQPWGQFIQEKATEAGLSPEGVQIVSEGIVAAAPPPAQKPTKGSKEKEAPVPVNIGPEETVVEANLKKINVRQLTKFVQQIENGGRTIKVRRLQVDTHPDESGYLDVTVVVSAFRMKQ